MPRPIIKTRPQRPYIVARIILVAIVVIVIATAIAYAIAEKRAHPHGATLGSVRAAARQDLLAAAVNSKDPHIPTFSRGDIH